MNKRLWLMALGLFIVNLALAYSFPVNILQPDGTPVVLSRWKAVQNLAIMLAFWMPFASGLVAAIIAMVPYGGLEYGKRYPRVFVFTLIGAYLFWIVIGATKLSTV